ncbi:MAG TPA: hypothetical protein VLS93_03490 [Anaeromyxobacteraceae bacterium]|nr:hypothetical protein [Anaeromyxobacteraceae bacterium]
MRNGALAAAAALAALPAGAAGEVEARAALRLRATFLENAPAAEIRYDRDLRGFAVDGYLSPSQDDRFASALVALALEGRHAEGRLRWALAVDSGQLRETRFPAIAPVCRAPTSPTGLTGCPAYAAHYLLDETRPADPTLTSNGRPVAEEVEATVFLREAWLAGSFGRAGLATVRAGRKRVVVGDGFVFDDYGTAAELSLDLGAAGPPFDLGVAVLHPSRDFPRAGDPLSPLLVLRADFLPSLFERAGLFAAALRDRSGSMGELFRSGIAEALATRLAAEALGSDRYKILSVALAETLSARLESEATALWLGTSGSLSVGRGHRLSWTAAAMGGRVERVGRAGGATLAEDVRLRGKMASARWESGIGERAVVSGEILYLSGSRPLTPTVEPGAEPGTVRVVPATGAYPGFLGISPFVTFTNLFFGGGLADSFDAREATAPGVNGRGVVAPALGAVLDPRDGLSVEAKAAWLLADVAGPTGGRTYGTEVDLLLSWRPRDGVRLGLELDALFTGDFFPSAGPVYKGILALDLTTP